MNTRLLVVLIVLLVVLPLATGHSQNQNPSARQSGVLRLRARVKLSDSTPLRGLARKRFFLIHGSLEQKPRARRSNRSPTTRYARLLLLEK